MQRPKVVLGFSGGIDSVAAVDILRTQGYDVVALTLDMCGDCNVISKAKESADILNVKIEIADVKSLFNREIKEYFTAEYIAGRTPAPCTRCNPEIKWKSLLEYANNNSIEYIATGHYFRIVEHNGRLYVAKAADPKKDQSYYLWGLSQDVLSRAITPMADKIKSEVRQVSTIKRESMGVCFLDGRRYSDYIREICGEFPVGNIVDKDGNIISQHCGIAHYTIGQKRGEGIPANSSIIAIDKSRNELIIGEDKDLYHLKLIIKDCNIVDRKELLESNDISVMIRGIGRNPEGYASKIEPYDDGFLIHLSSPAWACAAGQPVVLYRGSRVIGGGYLDSSIVSQAVFLNIQQLILYSVIT